MQCPNGHGPMLRGRKAWVCEECETRLPLAAPGPPPTPGGLDRFPCLLAIPLAGYAREAHPVLRLHRLCDAVEILTRFCVIVALGEWRARLGGQPLPDALLRELQPRIELPTFGKWKGMLAALVRGLHPADPLVVPELPPFVNESLLPGLPGGEALPEQCLLTLRNLIAHGGAMTRDRAEYFLNGTGSGSADFAGWSAWLAGLLTRLDFLSDGPVCQWARGEARPLLGEQAVGPPLSLPADLRLALGGLDEHVVLLRGGRWLDLWPLHAFGPPRARAPRGAADPEGPTPLVFLRAEPARLVYAALGSRLPYGERPDLVADFRTLFRLGERPADEPTRPHDFEDEFRRDSAALVGREAEVIHCKQRIRAAAAGVLWLAGPGGIGKSFLVARLADELRGDPRKVCRIAWRFRAGDEARCNRAAFFRHAVAALARWPPLGLGDLTPAPDPERLFVQLRGALEGASRLAGADSAGRPPRVLFLIDGLDEVARSDPGFAEVPFRLTGPNVVWVCAGRPEGTLPQAFAPACCTHLFPGGLPPMSAEDVRGLLLDGTGALKYDLLALDREPGAAAGDGDTVGNAAVAAVVARAQGLPLYVRHVVEDLLSGHFRPADLLTRLPPGLAAYYDELLERLSLGDLQALLAPLVATLAWALAPLDEETLHLLMRRRKVLADGDEGRALLRRGLEAVGSMVRPAPLGDGRLGYEPYHPTFRDHVRADAGGRLSQQNRLARAEFADLAADWASLPPDHPARLYALRFGPHTLLEAGEWDRVETLLTDPHFLEAKTEAGLVFELAADLEAAAGRLPAGRPGLSLVGLLEKCLRRVLHFVAAHPTTLFQSLWNAGWWYDSAEADAYHAPPEGGWGPAGPPWRHAGPRLSALLEGWRARKEAGPGFRWVRFRSPPADAACLTASHALLGHQLPVRGVAFTPDGRRLVSGSHDLTVRVWDVRSGVELAQGRGHAGWITAVAVSPDGRLLASSADDGTVRVWDADGGRELLCLTGHEGEVRGVGFAPDGERLASAAADGTFRIWGLRDGRQLLRVTAHEPTERTVPLYHDRQHVVSEGTTSAVAFSPDGRLVATGSFDRTVRLWEARTGQERARCTGHEGLVRSVAFDPSGRLVASAADDATVRVWAVEGGREAFRLEHPAPVKCVAFAPDGGRLASGADDSIVRLWDPASGRLLARLGGHWGVINAAAFSPDGRQFASGAQDRTVRLWQLDREDRPGDFLAHGSWIDTVAFSPDGRYLVSSGQDGAVGVWDGSSGRLLRWLRHHRGPVRSVAVAPDGGQVASCGADGTVRLCGLPGGEEQLVLAGHQGGVNRLAYAADGRRLLSGGDDCTVRVWEVSSGRERACLTGHQTHVYGVALSADGRFVAAGAADGTIRLWQVEGAGAFAGLPAVLAGPRSTVSRLAFAAGGGRLVAVSWDKRVRVWEVETGTCLLDSPGIVSAAAVAAETGATRWRAVSVGWETLLVVPATGAVAARFLGAYNCLAAHPSGRAWAGAAGNHLVLFSLEGDGT